MPRQRLRALASFVFAASLGTACAVSDGRNQADDVGQVHSAIVGSKASDASQDAVVMLVFSSPASTSPGICTAVLVAPRLVLTARHCVADTDADVACNVAGNATRGGVIRGNHAPGSLYVFTGKDRPLLEPKTWTPAGLAAEVLDDGSKNLCNHDLAFVLLEQPIANVPLASLRLEGGAAQGEVLTTVGWGVTSTDDAPPTRQQRSRVHVTRVGPDETSPVLAPSEFAFDESICLGDSGGPIFSGRSNAVIGVVSRGGNGDSTSASLASTCANATNLGTTLTPFGDLVMRAFSRANAEPQRESPATADAGDARAGCVTAPSNASSRESHAVWLGLAVVGLALRKRFED